MTSQAVKVNTQQFKREYGHEPRGRFLRTFRFGSERAYFSKRGEYQECLAAALARAAEKGVTPISVSSVVYGQDEGK